MASSGQISAWSYVFSSPGSKACVLCGRADRTTMVGSGGGDAGVCEACVINAYWSWKKLLPGDADPSPIGDVGGEVERVKVVVSRLQLLADGRRAPAGASESYELAMVGQPEGLDLPGTQLRKGEDEEEAVYRALSQVGFESWSTCIEPLYAAITPRGRLARVYLATAWAEVVSKTGAELPVQWRAWPPWEHAPGMAGLYLALRDVWRLCVWRHQASEPRTSSITTHVRRAAAEYLRMQLDKRSKRKDLDTSLEEVLRRSLDDDEVLVCRQILEHADREVELLSQQATEVVEVGEVGAPGGVVESDVAAASEVVEEGGEDDDFNPEDDHGG